MSNESHGLEDKGGTILSDLFTLREKLLYQLIASFNNDYSHSPLLFAN